MRFKAIFPLVFALSALGPATVHAQTAEQHFKAGVAAFQKSDLKGARASFTAALQADASNPVALFNLGLVEFKSGKPGLALGVWRKALAENPDDSRAARAILWAHEKLDRQEIPHEAEAWESFRAAFLQGASLTQFMVLCAGLMLASGWLLLRYFGARRRALLDEQPLPPFPTVATVLFTGFVFSVFLCAAKAYDSSVPRATIIAKKIEARSTPDTVGTPLFDLYEGLEVIVRQSAGEWTQVTYPGGPTGWLPRSTVFTTDDEIQDPPQSEAAK